MRIIIDAKYKKSDLNMFMAKQYQHLNTEERCRLLNLLNKFKDMFDGTLITWNTTPLEFELKDNVKPVCSRPYPVPRIQKFMFRKEAERLIDFGVI